jgi:type IV pilus assembly protein PilV
MNIGREKYQRGFSLFEVLIALVILALGMLGIAQMLLITHKSNSSNYIRQQAVQSAYNILDRIHANRSAALAGNYTVSNLVLTGSPTAPTAPATTCDTSICTSTQLAAYDLWYWLAMDVAQLPNGCGAVSSGISGVNTIVTVTVQWDDSPAQKALGTTNPSPTQFVIKSQL